MTALNDNQHPDRHQLDLEGDKIALCRCWKSKKFPYCDGSHRQYNQEHNDNLGPVIVCAKED